MIIARFGAGGRHQRVRVHDAGKALISALGHNPYSKWGRSHVDPAGWVSVYNILRHFKMKKLA
eukprot:366022-Alexandrium_andersonii.AAC.1